MDMQTDSTAQIMYGWEQYIYPPLESSLLTGDVIQLAEGAQTDPSSYRLVLTPSCDLQMNNGKCKVKDVLVAKCSHIDRFTAAILSGSKLKKEKLPEFLPRFLSEPHQGGYIPLPDYGSVLPAMTASLRDLELIPLQNVDASGSGGKSYVRIASVDSPFREFITWAYLQIIGRPGMPDRDLQAWADDILNPKTETQARETALSAKIEAERRVEPKAATEVSQKVELDSSNEGN
jgi:hypothetical protein